MSLQQIHRDDLLGIFESLEQFKGKAQKQIPQKKITKKCELVFLEKNQRLCRFLTNHLIHACMK